MAPKSELVRVAVALRGGARAQAVLDRGATLAGRGAYLCREPRSAEPNRPCLERALRRRAIPRALRAAVEIDPELLESVGR